MSNTVPGPNVPPLLVMPYRVEPEAVKAPYGLFPSVAPPANECMIVTGWAVLATVQTTAMIIVAAQRARNAIGMARPH
jgi:hypothetical protein